jgi:hypothetical protein
MAIELTNEDKLGIVNQHIRSIDYSIYGLQLDLLEAQAVGESDASTIANINSRIAAQNSKRAALVTEKNSLTVTEEQE